MITIDDMIENYKNRKVWELYIFPGGKVGEARTRLGVRLWMLLNFARGIERRAIHTVTEEHIVG